MSRRLDPEITKRALQLIDPKPARTEEARKQVADIIAILRAGRAARPDTVNKRELEQIASALRRAIAALKKPSVPDLQFRVHLSRNPGLAGLAGPLVDQLPTLREELAAMATAADSACKDIKLGRRGDHQKVAAAYFAHKLLWHHGVKPTHYTQGKFFQLADVLYEGSTGIKGADLSRACKRALDSLRYTLDAQGEFSQLVADDLDTLLNRLRK
jgi:hypothetical protein